MGGTDNEPVWRFSLSGKTCEHPVENAQAARADEAIVKGLVGAVLFGSIAPVKPVLDDEHDPAHYAQVVGASYTVRKRKIGLDAFSCAPLNQKRSLMADPSCQALESDLQPRENP